MKRSVLGIRQHRLERFQIYLAGQQPNCRKDLCVDAEPDQVGIADVREQPFFMGPELLEGTVAVAG